MKFEKKRLNSAKLALNKRPLPNVLDSAKLITLFDAIDDPTIMMACFTSFVCGLRISEVCNLKIADINLEERQIKIVNGKFNRDRLVKIVDDRYLPLFKKWLRLRGGREYFLPSLHRNNKHMSAQALSARFVIYLEKAGLRLPLYKSTNNKQRHMYTFHTLRHTFCTYLMKKGMKPQHVQKLMGHSDIQITMRYTHIIDTDIDDEVNRLFNNKTENKMDTHSQTYTNTPLNALELLKVKLVNGEIGEEEYLRKITLLNANY